MRRGVGRHRPPAAHSRKGGKGANISSSAVNGLPSTIGSSLTDATNDQSASSSTSSRLASGFLPTSANIASFFLPSEQREALVHVAVELLRQFYKRRFQQIFRAWLAVALRPELSGL